MIRSLEMMSPKIIELGPLKILSTIKSLTKTENTQNQILPNSGEKKPKSFINAGNIYSGKWLNSGKKRKVCGIFTCPIPILHFAGLRQL